ncbi:MAG: hypothetical protein SFU56_07995 [Capsulimonadales bacterium]|nr:hypothetical protein [Capsulimonadales bacterium]
MKNDTQNTASVLFRPSLLLAAAGVISALLTPVATSARQTPEYTGIVIDVRHLTEIDRSPAPVIYGPAPKQETLYPDPAHVPTPDEVQDNSVVRYYHTPEQAEKGVAGEHPLIVRAEAVVGPAHDSVRVTAEDAEILKNADKTLRYSRNWKVAFLIPEGH